MGNTNDHNSNSGESSSTNKWAGIITALGSLVLAITGLITAFASAGLIGPKSTPTVEATETVAPTEIIANEETDIEADEPATSIAPTPVPEEPTDNPYPNIFNFKACPQPCSSSNPTYSFQGGIQKIYAEWEFENFPRGANYVRSWSMDGEEWIRYECAWPGPENGIDRVELREPGGLHSGTWEILISVDDSVVLQEEIIIEGNWDYWAPAGIIDRCR